MKAMNVITKKVWISIHRCSGYLYAPNKASNAIIGRISLRVCAAEYTEVLVAAQCSTTVSAPVVTIVATPVAPFHE